jgi:acyl carrier protein
MTKDELFDRLKTILIDEFELEESKITSDAKLNEDLDLDSIDAVDMIVKMKQYIPDKITPNDFKNVKTVGDVVNVLYPHLSK